MVPLSSRITSPTRNLASSTRAVTPQFPSDRQVLRFFLAIRPIRLRGINTLPQLLPRLLLPSPKLLLLTTLLHDALNLNLISSTILISIPIQSPPSNKTQFPLYPHLLLRHQYPRLLSRHRFRTPPGARMYASIPVDHTAATAAVIRACSGLL